MTYYQNNKEKRRAYARVYYDAHKQERQIYSQNHRVQKRLNRLKSRYGVGIDHAVYSQMLKDQKGVCAICGNSETQKTMDGDIHSLALDHDHATGKVRSLLCKNCNLGLGYFGDDLVRLQKAVAYLVGHGMRLDNSL